MLLSLILFFLISSSLSRILEHHDPKVDPLSLDNVVSKIVDSTMDDLRFRLRQAIYALALRQSDIPPQNIGKYEDYLLQEFLHQLRKQPKTFEELQRVEEPSHTMSIALETHTTDPLMIQRDDKLITTSDLRMMDSVDQPLFLSHSSFSLWIVLLVPSCIILLIFIFCTLYCIRRQRKKVQVRLPTLPNPYTISAYNGPGAFLERLRESESVWSQAPSMGNIQRVQ